MISPSILRSRRGKMHFQEEDNVCIRNSVCHSGVHRCEKKWKGESCIDPSRVNEKDGQLAETVREVEILGRKEVGRMYLGDMDIYTKWQGWASLWIKHQAVSNIKGAWRPRWKEGNFFFHSSSSYFSSVAAASLNFFRRLFFFFRPLISFSALFLHFFLLILQGDGCRFGNWTPRVHFQGR